MGDQTSGGQNISLLGSLHQRELRLSRGLGRGGGTVRASAKCPPHSWRLTARPGSGSLPERAGAGAGTPGARGRLNSGAQALSITSSFRKHVPGPTGRKLVDSLSRSVPSGAPEAGAFPPVPGQGQLSPQGRPGSERLTGRQPWPPSPTLPPGGSGRGLPGPGCPTSGCLTSRCPPQPPGLCPTPGCPHQPPGLCPTLGCPTSRCSPQPHHLHLTSGCSPSLPPSAGPRGAPRSLPASALLPQHPGL